ncbi:MAG: histidine phosphatase family protein [Gallionella sp.]|jgi:phosphohistidine phosphatase SixA|nr:histidine phosphatase family protein [Gallionella sp.]MCK9354436.1 histidine phosphatase family protein [Gallionella sp.]
MRSVFALFAALSLLSLPVAAAKLPVFVEKPVTSELIKQLRAGGYVLYLRHGNTDTSRPDRVPSVDLNDCSTQRPLTGEGVRVVTRVGEAIRKAKIPVGEIFSSPLCRAKESAAAAFGANFVIDNSLMYTANMTSEEKKPVIDKTRALLSAPVSGTTNRVLVAHAPNLMDLMGYFPKPEGTLVVFRPLGNGGFEYLGNIAPQQWQEVLR